MPAKKLIVVILMMVIVGVGANVLRLAVSRSQAAYHPPTAPSEGDYRRSADDPSKWHLAPADVKSAATKTILAQLDAFKRDDYVSAISYQAGQLRGHFPSAAGFRQTIQRGYPQFAHYKSIVFGDTKASSTKDSVAVQAMLTGEDGVTVTCVYFMHHEDGSYKVAGVMGGMVKSHSVPQPLRKGEKSL